MSAFVSPSLRRNQRQARTTQQECAEYQQRRQTEPESDRQPGAEQRGRDGDRHGGDQTPSRFLTGAKVGARPAMWTEMGTTPRDRQQAPGSRASSTARAPRHLVGPRDRADVRFWCPGERVSSLATRPKSAAVQDQLGRLEPRPLSQRNRTLAKRRREEASRSVKRTANPVGVVRTTSEESSISKDPG